TGTLVHALLTDPVRRPGLELVEMNPLVVRGGKQPDRHVDQAEAQRPRPDRSGHLDSFRRRGIQSIMGPTVLTRICTHIHHPVTPSEHTGFQDKRRADQGVPVSGVRLELVEAPSTARFAHEAMLGLADLEPEDLTHGNLTVPLGLSLWMRRGGIGVEDARDAM